MVSEDRSPVKRVRSVGSRVLALSTGATERGGSSPATAADASGLGAGGIDEPASLVAPAAPGCGATVSPPDGAEDVTPGDHASPSTSTPPVGASRASPSTTPRGASGEVSRSTGTWT